MICRHMSLFHNRDDVRQADRGEGMVEVSSLWLERNTRERSAHCPERSDGKPAAAKNLRACAVCVRYIHCTFTVVP